MMFHVAALSFGRVRWYFRRGKRVVRNGTVYTSQSAANVGRASAQRRWPELTWVVVPWKGGA